MTDTPLLMLDRWLSILRYGRGVVFIMPSAAAVQAALRKLKRYGVRTYGYKLHANGTREFRVRRRAGRVGALPARGQSAAGLGGRSPRAAARSVGFAGMVLDFFQRF